MDYSALTIAKLKDKLNERGIPLRGLKRKGQFIERLQLADQETAVHQSWYDQQQRPAPYAVPQQGAQSAAAQQQLLHAAAQQPVPVTAVQQQSQPAVAAQQPQHAAALSRPPWLTTSYELAGAFPSNAGLHQPSLLAAGPQSSSLLHPPTTAATYQYAGLPPPPPSSRRPQPRRVPATAAPQQYRPLPPVPRANANKRAAPSDGPPHAGAGLMKKPRVNAPASDEQARFEPQPATHQPAAAPRVNRRKRKNPPAAASDGNETAKRQRLPRLASPRRRHPSPPHRQPSPSPARFTSPARLPSTDGNALSESDAALLTLPANSPGVDYFDPLDAPLTPLPQFGPDDLLDMPTAGDAVVTPPAVAASAAAPQAEATTTQIAAPVTAGITEMPSVYSLHKPTRAVYVSGVARPVQLLALLSRIEGLEAGQDGEETGAIERFYLNRAHCFVVLSSAALAIQVRNGLHGQRSSSSAAGGGSMWADFVPEDKVHTWIQREEEGAAGQNSTQRWEVVYEMTPAMTIEAELRDVATLTPAEIVIHRHVQSESLYAEVDEVMPLTAMVPQIHHLDGRPTEEVRDLADPLRLRSAAPANYPSTSEEHHGSSMPEDPNDGKTLPFLAPGSPTMADHPQDLLVLGFDAEDDRPIGPYADWNEFNLDNPTPEADAEDVDRPIGLYIDWNEFFQDNPTEDLDAEDDFRPLSLFTDWNAYLGEHPT